MQNGDTAKIQTVTTAQTTANSVGLSAGLNAGDLVVVDGQDKLQDGSKVHPSTPSTLPPNAQQPSSQQSNTKTGANGGRRSQAPQPNSSTGKR